MKIFYAVVLYNKNLEESLTCGFLKDILKTNNVWIADNSTKANNVKEKCKELKWNYISMNGNKGLPKAYNTIIEDIISNNVNFENDFIMTLDDDTQLTIEYIKLLEESYSNSKDVDVFVPIIKDEKNTIISPAKYKKIRRNNLKNEFDALNLDNEKFMAINTCSTIKLSIFKNYRYNEKLFLDNVDHQFYYDMRKENKKFLCVNCVIKQSFFSTSNTNYKKEAIRKRIMIKDYKVFVSDKSLLEKILCYPRIISWALKGCIKFKNIRFLFELLKKY